MAGISDDDWPGDKSISLGHQLIEIWLFGWSEQIRPRCKPASARSCTRRTFWTDVFAKALIIFEKDFRHQPLFFNSFQCLTWNLSKFSWNPFSDFMKFFFASPYCKMKHWLSPERLNLINGNMLMKFLTIMIKIVRRLVNDLTSVPYWESQILSRKLCRKVHSLTWSFSCSLTVTIDPGILAASCFWGHVW